MHCSDNLLVKTSVLPSNLNVLFYLSFQDGHEICFVGDEAFIELSTVDPKGDELLDTVSQLFVVF